MNDKLFNAFIAVIIILALFGAYQSIDTAINCDGRLMRTLAGPLECIK